MFINLFPRLLLPTFILLLPGVYASLCERVVATSCKECQCSAVKLPVHPRESTPTTLTFQILDNNWTHINNSWALNNYTNMSNPTEPGTFLEIGTWVVAPPAETWSRLPPDGQTYPDKTVNAFQAQLADAPKDCDQWEDIFYGGFQYESIYGSIQFVVEVQYMCSEGDVYWLTSTLLYAPMVSEDEKVIVSATKLSSDKIYTLVAGRKETEDYK